MSTARSCSSPFRSSRWRCPPPRAQLRDPNAFKSGIDVTGVTVTVRDADGKLVTGLTRDDFEVFEDGDPQPITQFTRERVPVSVGVLLDMSDSMFGRPIEDAREAVNGFLFEQLDAQDEFFILAFNHRPHVMTTWTHTADVVRQALDSLKPTGGTAVYDATLEALPLIARRNRERGALLIVSDGADTASTAGLKEVRFGMRRSQAFVYAIAIDRADEGHQPERQPFHAPRDHRRERRPHRGGPEQRRHRRGVGAHRRRAQSPVRARLHAAARRGRQVSLHSRPCPRRRLPHPRPQGLRRGTRGPHHSQKVVKKVVRSDGRWLTLCWQKHGRVGLHHRRYRIHRPAGRGDAAPPRSSGARARPARVGTEGAGRLRGCRRRSVRQRDVRPRTRTRRHVPPAPRRRPPVAREGQRNFWKSTCGRPARPSRRPPPRASTTSST